MQSISISSRYKKTYAESTKKTIWVPLELLPCNSGMMLLHAQFSL